MDRWISGLITRAFLCIIFMYIFLTARAGPPLKSILPFRRWGLLMLGALWRLKVIWTVPHIFLATDYRFGSQGVTLKEIGYLFVRDLKNIYS